MEFSYQNIDGISSIFKFCEEDDDDVISLEFEYLFGPDRLK